jgi:WD40 repeat protein
MEKMQVIRRFKGHASSIRASLAWARDGKTFLSGSWDGSVRLWDLQNGEEIAHLQPGYGRVMSLALSPDGKYALSSYLSGPDRPVILWDLESQHEINRFGIPGYRRYGEFVHMESVAFSPDGKTALFGFVFGTVIWWDLDKWELIAMNRLHEDELTFVAFSADGKMSFSVGTDAKTDRNNIKVKFWQLPDRDIAEESK